MTNLESTPQSTPQSTLKIDPNAVFNIEYSAISSASPSQIWPLYSQVAQWKVWDHAIEDSTLEGEFVTGSVGTLTPTGGQRLPFTLTEVQLERVFVTDTPLPGAKVIFNHVLEPVQGGTRITHQIEIVGPEAARFAAIFGDNMLEHMPAAVRGIVQLSQKYSSQPV
jgi:hypothetical protein